MKLATTRARHGTTRPSLRAIALVVALTTSFSSQAQGLGGFLGGLKNALDALPAGAASAPGGGALPLPLPANKLTGGNTGAAALNQALSPAQGAPMTGTLAALYTKSTVNGADLFDTLKAIKLEARAKRSAASWAAANAAFEQDPGLMEFALSKHVIPATPANLVTLLKTIQSNWHYDEIEEKAEKIAKLGTQLYERLRVVGDHMTKMQKSLTKTVEAFNDMTSSVESRLMVTARELHREQLISRQGDKVAEVSYVDKLPRPVQSPELLAGPEGERSE